MGIEIFGRKNIHMYRNLDSLHNLRSTLVVTDGEDHENLDGCRPAAVLKYIWGLFGRL